jgi:hypothetical protein
MEIEHKNSLTEASSSTSPLHNNQSEEAEKAPLIRSPDTVSTALSSPSESDAAHNLLLNTFYSNLSNYLNNRMVNGSTVARASIANIPANNHSGGNEQNDEQNDEHMMESSDEFSAPQRRFSSGLLFNRTFAHANAQQAKKLLNNIFDPLGFNADGYVYI